MELCGIVCKKGRNKTPTLILDPLKESPVEGLFKRMVLERLVRVDGHRSHSRQVEQGEHHSMVGKEELNVKGSPTDSGQLINGGDWIPLTGH